jgi:hypothetical protein
MAMDKTYAKKKTNNSKEKQMKRLRSGNYTQKTLSEHKDEAKQLTTKHVENWASRGDREVIERIKALLVKQ